MSGDAGEQELVAGKYRVTSMLGRGGMGSVWEGVHVSLGTRVAIKFIEAEYADSPEARSRFENEARAAAALRSKHVVQVHDHGVMPDGRPYIVMEFLTGEPLDRRLDRVGVLSLQDTAQIVTQVCRALGRAHEAGIIHRDLKPENVFLVRDEEEARDVAKVVDFGIAKFTGTSSGLSSSTKTGAVLGTPYYMSPEQARGLRSVDARSDLWSVAVIAYRCVVGALPFDGEAVGDLLVKICTAPIPVPSQARHGLPPAFDAWMARALAREPAERFQSAAEMADALSRAVGLTPAGAWAPPPGVGAAVPATTGGFGIPAPGSHAPYATPYPGGAASFSTPYPEGGAQPPAADGDRRLGVTTPGGALTHTVGGTTKSGPLLGLLLGGGAAALALVGLAGWLGYRAVTGSGAPAESPRETAAAPPPPSEPAPGPTSPPTPGPEESERAPVPSGNSSAAEAPPPDPATPRSVPSTGRSPGRGGAPAVKGQGAAAPPPATTSPAPPPRKGGDVDIGY